MFTRCLLKAIKSRFVFASQMVYDGNFSAQLFKPKGQDDIGFREGTGFMVGDRRYKEHLQVAQESKQVAKP